MARFVLGYFTIWKVRPSTFQSLRLRPLSGARQPCSDWLDARHLANVLIHPSQQGFSSWAVFLCCEQISAVSKFFEQILARSKFDFREQFFLTVSKFSSLRAIYVYIEIVSCVHTWIASRMKGNSWFSVSKFIEQIFAHNKFAHCEQISWAIFFSE